MCCGDESRIETGPEYRALGGGGRGNHFREPRARSFRHAGHQGFVVAPLH